MQVIVPCKDCKERAIRCHSVCEKYNQYRKDLEEQKQAEEHLKKERCREMVEKTINRKIFLYYKDVSTKTNQL